MLFRSDTARKLQDMLEVVVTDGTARDSRLDGYTAAGKTGTAQKIDEHGRYGSHKYVASFAGYAPASNPALALIVVIDEPAGAYYGAQVAAPIFKNIAEQVLRYKSVPPDVPFYAPEYKFKDPAPKQVGPRKPQPVVSDGALAQNAAFEDGDAVHIVPLGIGSEFQGPQQLGGVSIPDFAGKDLRQVADACLKAGLKLQSAGSGLAVEQIPPPGVSVRPGSRVRVRFSTRL